MWFPLHGHSHFSLLDGLGKPEQIAQRIVEAGYTGCALTDHGTISGIPPFIKAMRKAGVKPIAGCEFYISKQDATVKDVTNTNSHLCVLAKGKEGWKNLIQATSRSNEKEYFYRKPRLSLEQLASFSQNQFIAFSGHMGSALADVCFEEPKMAYNVEDLGQVRSLVHPQWKQRVCTKIDEYVQLLGKENFFVEIQLIDQETLPASYGVAQMLRQCAKEMGVPCVATADSHYPNKQDAADQRVLLCTALKTTMRAVNEQIAKGGDVGLSTFFKSNRYHIPDLEEMQAIHTPEEIANALQIADMCTDFDVAGSPLLPEFGCPDGMTPDEYLKKLCVDGWRQKVQHLPADQHQEYKERIKMELGVLQEANLSSYFLIVRDYIIHAKEVLGCLIGEGRGSAAGCLVSYLIDITTVDPIQNGLIFERFYNAGRNTKDRIALPDIDTDFPITKRDGVIDYIRETYGEAYVCQMATFSRIQGRGAMKDVLRVHERCSYDEMNLITSHIPDEAEISDQLQLMEEETGDASIIRWALENNSEALKNWCEIGEDGNLTGPLALDFAQAIRLEGTKRNMGKHASGLIVSSLPLAEVAPMIYDRSTGQPMVSVDMRDAENMGLVKLDILGTAVLDKMMDAQDIIRNGFIHDD